MSGALIPGAAGPNVDSQVSAKNSKDRLFATGRILDYETLVLLEASQSLDATMRDLEAIRTLESEALALHQTFSSQGCREQFSSTENPGIRVWRGRPEERTGELLLDLEFGDNMAGDAATIVAALRRAHHAT